MEKYVEKFKRVKDYLLIHDDDELLDIILEINSFNGSLDFMKYYYNDDEFLNTFFKDNPAEAVRSAFYGNYNYCDDWVKINGCGNLESTDSYGRVKEARYYIDEVVTELLKVYEEIEVSQELKEILED